MTKYLAEASAVLVLLGAAAAGSVACRAGAEPPSVAQPAAASETVTLSVEGMTCASCTTAVRIALKKLDGVRDARVSYENKRATVEYEPAKVKPEQLAAAVTALGYETRVVGP